MTMLENLKSCLFRSKRIDSIHDNLELLEVTE